MQRVLAGIGSVVLLAGAGLFFWTGRAQGDGEAVPEPPARAGSAPLVAGSPARPPSADERTREQRRFDRADRDNDGRVTLAEISYGRRRNYDRLDTNHDGQLSFEEWAVRLLQRFATADADRDQALSRPEFATTAPPPRRTAASRVRCNCASRGSGQSGGTD